MNLVCSVAWEAPRSDPDSPECVEKKNSAKFTVANSSSTHRQTLNNGLQSIPLASKCGHYVVFVAPLCIKGLRLVTVQRPEKSWPIRPEQRRPTRRQYLEKFARIGQQPSLGLLTH